jgi:hypothetical protein
MSKVKVKEVDCARAQGLMSPYIDSMATPREGECLELHLSACRPCQRQLQSLISMRGLLARMEKPGLPQDLMLEARVRLSRERNRNILVKLETRLSNLLKPIALPAVFGASLTMLFFGILLGCFASNETALAQTRINDEPVFSLYKPVHTTDQTMIRFAASDNQTWDEPLMIETDVGNDGRVTDYRIISGPQNDEVNRWIREVLSLAQFTPAIAFGEPVESKIILSFVAVRS